MMETIRDLFIMCWPDWTSISLCWPCSSYSSPLLKLYLCPHCNLLIYSKLYFFFHFPSFNCPLPFSDVDYSLIMAVRYMPKLISYFFYCLLFCPKFCLFCWKWNLLSECCYFVLYGSVQYTTLFPNSIRAENLQKCSLLYTISHISVSLTGPGPFGYQLRSKSWSIFCVLTKQISWLFTIQM